MYMYIVHIKKDTAHSSPSILQKYSAHLIMGLPRI